MDSMYDPQAVRDRIYAARQAGLTVDRTKTRELLSCLRKEADESEAVEALHALALLGDNDIVPDLMEATEQAGVTAWAYYARIAAARIRAANVAAGERSKQGATARITEFLRLLNVSVPDLNEARAVWERRRLEITPMPPTFELRILRELADMIYRSRDPYPAAARDLGISFEDDPPSALKVRLHGLSQEERVRCLLEDLSRRQVLKSDDYITIQLAADEGLPAGRAAAERLREMQANRVDYPGDVNFKALFLVIASVGDAAQADVAASFLTDEDDWVRDYAERYHMRIKQGKPGVVVVGA